MPGVVEIVAAWPVVEARPEVRQPLTALQTTQLAQQPLLGSRESNIYLIF